MHQAKEGNCSVSDTSANMSSNILFLELNQSLACFSNQLAKQLAKGAHNVKRWCFHLDQDEVCTLETILGFLETSIREASAAPILIGHGIGGILANTFAQRYPGLIKGVVLLSTDAITEYTWQAQYHEIRKMLPNAREDVLGHLSHLLTGHQCPGFLKATSGLLKKSLDEEYSLSSLMTSEEIPKCRKHTVPMLIINGDDDFIVDRNSNARWQPFLKRGDRYVSISHGRHFMQHTHIQDVSEAVNAFIEMTPDSAWLETGIKHMTHLWQSTQNG